MDNERLRQGVRELIADVGVRMARMDAKDAVGWLVVSVDQESGSMCAFGTYATPEEALIDAQRQDEDVNRGLPEGEPGWRHVVLPLFKPDSKREP